jgi:hypothetical protein
VLVVSFWKIMSQFLSVPMKKRLRRESYLWLESQKTLNAWKMWQGCQFGTAQTRNLLWLLICLKLSRDIGIRELWLKENMLP